MSTDADLSLSPLNRRCADALADEVAALVRLRVIDSRSPAADALLDYREPPSTPRADRIAQLTSELAEARAQLAKVCSDRDEMIHVHDELIHIHDEVETERKAARAELERMKADLAAVRGYLVDNPNSLGAQLQRAKGELAEAVELFAAQSVERDMARVDAAAMRDFVARLTTQRDVAQATIVAERDWCAAWLIRARFALFREGWEEGMSIREASEALTSVLYNLGCDDGTGRPEDIVETKRLLQMRVAYAPPSRREVIARVTLWRELESLCTGTVLRDDVQAIITKLANL